MGDKGKYIMTKELVPEPGIILGSWLFWGDSITGLRNESFNK